MRPEVLFDKQAAYVRRLYCDARNLHAAKRGHETRFGENIVARWDGGTDSDAREHKPIWPKIVTFCVKHDISPAVLVRAVFHNDRGNFPPQPTMLISSYALELARRLGEQERRELKSQLIYYSNQTDTYYTIFQHTLKLDPLETWRHLLVVCPPNLSQLYRYCLAKRAMCDDLAVPLFNPALADYYWLKDAYDAEWGDMIPASLRQPATELKEQILTFTTQRE